jgi:hypothetical protein
VSNNGPTWEKPKTKNKNKKKEKTRKAVLQKFHISHQILQHLTHPPLPPPNPQRRWWSPRWTLSSGRSRAATPSASSSRSFQSPTSLGRVACDGSGTPSPPTTSSSPFPSRRLGSWSTSSESLSPGASGGTVGSASSPFRISLWGGTALPVSLSSTLFRYGFENCLVAEKEWETTTKLIFLFSFLFCCLSVVLVMVVNYDYSSKL